MAGGNEHEKEENKTFTDILAMHMAFILYYSAIWHSCCFLLFLMLLLLLLFLYFYCLSCPWSTGRFDRWLQFASGSH